MIAIIASVCLGLFCRDVVVTTSEQDRNITMMSCAIGQRELADWMRMNWPGYRLGGWKCILGSRHQDT